MRIHHAHICSSQSVVFSGLKKKQKKDGKKGKKEKEKGFLIAHIETLARKGQDETSVRDKDATVAGEGAFAETQGPSHEVATGGVREKGRKPKGRQRDLAGLSVTLTEKKRIDGAGKTVDGKSHCCHVTFEKASRRDCTESTRHGLRQRKLALRHRPRNRLKVHRGCPTGCRGNIWSGESRTALSRSHPFADIDILIRLSDRISAQKTRQCDSIDNTSVQSPEQRATTK